jgi:hypothetical protein
MVYVNELRPGFVSVTISVLGKQTSVLQTEQVNDRFNYQAFPTMTLLPELPSPFDPQSRPTSNIPW